MAIDNTTQGDSLVDAQNGSTDEGFRDAYMAQPWDRGLSLMENEPVRAPSVDDGMAGMPIGGWVDTTRHPSSEGRIPAPTGAATQVGAWPISGDAIHSRGPGMQAERDLGPGLSRGTPPGCEQMNY